MKINIELEIAPGEIGLATELLATLRQIDQISLLAPRILLTLPHAQADHGTSIVISSPGCKWQPRSPCSTQSPSNLFLLSINRSKKHATDHIRPPQQARRQRKEARRPEPTSRSASDVRVPCNLHQPCSLWTPRVKCCPPDRDDDKERIYGHQRRPECRVYLHGAFCEASHVSAIRGEGCCKSKACTLDHH